MLHAWWAARIPDRLALITPHGDRTYEDLNADINRVARALRDRGLQPGDAIALMCTNRPEFVEVLYAVPAHRPAPHPHQLAPDRRRGGLHRRELRGQGVRLLG